MKVLPLLLSCSCLSPLVAADSAPPLGAATELALRWDRNADGRLQLAEIDRALADPQVKGDAAAAAAALRRTLGEARTSEIESGELQQSASTLGKLSGHFAWAKDRLAKANRQLWATTPPRIETLKQGRLGDCFCLAALKTVLHRDPLEITRMIQPLDDGSYRVQIGAATVNVPALTDGEIILGANTTDGLWPLVYEKAVGLSRIKPDATEATPFNVVTKGGSAGAMMAQLTAHEIRRWSCQTWREAAADPARQAELLADLRAQLQSAFAEKRLVTGGTGSLGKGRTGVPSITYMHGYAVLGYDAAADTITLWNPRAGTFTPKGAPGLENGYAMENGRQTIPLAELVTFFGGFAFEQHPSASSAR